MRWARVGAILTLALALTPSARGQTELCANEDAFMGEAQADYVCYVSNLEGAACPAGCLGSGDFCDCARTGMAVDQDSCAELLPGESDAFAGVRQCLWSARQESTSARTGGLRPGG